MIEISGQTYTLNDPVVLLILATAGAIFLVLILLVLAVRAAGRSARMTEPLARQMQALGGHVQQLGMGQEQLRGGLQTVSDTQANAQAQMI
ncbi:MAG TPA: DNA recombination protein RmuC, partial [Roseobacter sp.]|nr:DNA recombination protein RmuC [Roseobacter sp.]